MLEAGGSCLWVYGRDNTLYVRSGMGFHSSSPNVTRIGVFLFFSRSCDCGFIQERVPFVAVKLPYDTS